ncbi:hypothetical protein [Nostoc sp. MS1]|uniref:hypothetical protein n=1 Tax=Nostoc sp. MS1 TaxID=2764711 RepID=UPI00295EF4AE|nr:hypothetical protein [Nostoc sp. MS1]BCL38435.1 hypothetical protein NSMS1_48820 [Nostoc sp. MS1]
MYINKHFEQKKQTEEDISSASCSPDTLNQTICGDCAFCVEVKGALTCIHPEELGVNCATVIFCNSFQPAQEIDSPCVTFGNDDAE